MNRRRFLKYAGATAAVVGASALGVDFLLKESISKSNGAYSASLTTTGSSTTTVPLTSVETTTTEQLTTLSLGENDLGGYVFHDYNGNGILDESEPLVDDVEIVAQGSYATVRTQPSHGLYVFRNLPKGLYRVYPVHPENKFRYMCRSNAELVETKQGYTIDFRGRQKLDMALMEGFLTSPFFNIPKIESYVDLDPGSGIRDWRGGQRTYDGHPGTDFLVNEGTKVVAAAPGNIIASSNGWPNNPLWQDQSYNQNGNFVIINHGKNLYTAYHHLASTTNGDIFWSEDGLHTSRGEVIGYSDTTGRDITIPHLHFQIWQGSFESGRVQPLDPFRDLFFGKHHNSPWSNQFSLWTKDNDIRFLQHPTIP